MRRRTPSRPVLHPGRTQETRARTRKYPARPRRHPLRPTPNTPAKVRTIEPCPNGGWASRRTYNYPHLSQARRLHQGRRPMANQPRPAVGRPGLAIRRPVGPGGGGGEDVGNCRPAGTGVTRATLKPKSLGTQAWACPGLPAWAGAREAAGTPRRYVIRAHGNTFRVRPPSTNAPSPAAPPRRARPHGPAPP